jgi:eukaryotic-like serine/threonine-protein kinase
MSSRTPRPSRPSNHNRAAFGSPGALLAPLDSEAQNDYRQDRIGLFTRLFLAIGGFFLVAGSLFRGVFLQSGPLRGELDLPFLVHLGVLALLAAGWYSTRRRLWSARALPCLDAGLVLLALSAQAFQLSRLRLGPAHHADQMMVLITYCVLMIRAVTVPSKPLTTFVIGSFGIVPALLVATWDGGRRGVLSEALAFAAIWSSAGVLITTFISHVIYGLRESVSQAQQLGQYVIERKLGEGGMGEVYLARHTLLRRLTAVKLLPPERAGEKTVARFEREVRATSRLTHPNTVGIFDYGRTGDGVFYYAMEYLEGLDLQRLVQEHGPLAPARVVHVLAQIAGALHEAHGAGLVHRDLKPANVFLCERGGRQDTVKVLDFGLVKDHGTGEPPALQTEVNALIGTPTYLSPESIHSPAEVDARTDLYAVGAIGYFLLTGREVFEGNSVVALCLAHLHEKPIAPSVRSQRALPAKLEALILSCLEKAPEARPQSASALRKALLDCDVPAWSDDDAEDWWQRSSRQTIATQRAMAAST